MNAQPYDSALRRRIERKARWIARTSEYGDDVADDLAQDAWIAILARRTRCDPAGIYLDAEAKIAKLAMWDSLRSQRRHRVRARCDESRVYVEPGMLSLFDLKLALGRIAVAQGWRVKLALCGYSSREIAAAEGRKERAVDRDLESATQELAAVLAPGASVGRRDASTFTGEPCPSGHTLRARSKHGRSYCMACARERAARNRKRKQSPTIVVDVCGECGRTHGACCPGAATLKLEVERETMRPLRLVATIAA